MLRLIPGPLHRAGLVVAHAVRVRWWRFRKPLLLGCRVLAFDEDDRVLLIRHSYGSGRWMLPGGGVGRGEDPLAAALRELSEEVGCQLAEAQLFDAVDEPLFGTTNRVYLVCGRLIGTPRPDGREVIEALFHSADDLPGNLSPTLDQGLIGWITAARAARQPG